MTSESKSETDLKVRDENSHSSSQHVADSSYTPLGTSKKNNQVTLQDKEHIDRLRRWIKEYFVNEFTYDSLLFMYLSKVRDYIFNQQI